jgi:hypothetical protein
MHRRLSIGGSVRDFGLTAFRSAKSELSILRDLASLSTTSNYAAYARFVFSSPTPETNRLFGEDREHSETPSECEHNSGIGDYKQNQSNQSQD